MTRDVWMCFAGGNALGAFHVGAWSAVEAADLRVTRVSGASIGAVVAAIIGGNPPERRAEALRGFVKAISRTMPPFMGRRALAMQTLLAGNPTLFVPSFPGMLEVLPWMPADSSAFRREPMARLIERFIDFDILNRGNVEVTVTALDAATGVVVDFRNTEQRLGIEHLMASTALPVLFRPVLIDGRELVDPGTCENLPLRPLLDRDDDALILALDLFALAGPVKTTMDGMACRAQELGFAGQSALVIAASDLAQRRFRHIVLSDPADNMAAKAFDFSAKTLTRRVELGRTLAEAELEGVQSTT